MRSSQSFFMTTLLMSCFINTYSSDNQKLPPFQERYREPFSRGMIVFGTAVVVSAFEQAARVCEGEEGQMHFASNSLKTYKIYLLVKTASLIITPVLRDLFKKN